MVHENLWHESIGEKMAHLLGIPKAWEIVHIVFKNGAKAIFDDCVSPRYWSNGLWERILLREHGICNDNIIFSKIRVEWIKACAKDVGRQSLDAGQKCASHQLFSEIREARDVFESISTTWFFHQTNIWNNRSGG